MEGGQQPHGGSAGVRVVGEAVWREGVEEAPDQPVEGEPGRGTPVAEEGRVIVPNQSIKQFSVNTLLLIKE